MSRRNRAQITARIPDQLREELLNLAEAHDRPLSYEIRRGLLNHVERTSSEESSGALSSSRPLEPAASRAPEEVAPVVDARRRAGPEETP
jgi:hypothetical protein